MIRREKLGVEPGEAPPKVSKSRRVASTTRVVKKGATRKKKA
jgi:DNA topoisomerase-1